MDADANGALSGFNRFPTWKWRNADVLDFVGWLRAHNDEISLVELNAGFYGLDLYSLSGSMQAVLQYLDKVDREAAKRARYRYSCFDQFHEDTRAYGYAAGFGLTESCEREVTAQLAELRRHAIEHAASDQRVTTDEHFYAEQNARLVKIAEEYYRSMFGGRQAAWNLRDRHMADTLEHLIGFLRGQGQRGNIVVWAHNAHLGDARATERGEGGEINLGQLVRERYKDQAVLIGLSTHEGTVTAASEWDATAERKHIPPALENSYESLFHRAGPGDFVINLHDERLQPLRECRLERAIGVVYRPEPERVSQYFYADLPAQFDVMLHFDRTRAVEPLERTAKWTDREAPDTYPTGV